MSQTVELSKATGGEVMMAGDSIEFCKGIKLSKMTGATPPEWATKWYDRIFEHYLAPAESLNRNRQGFGAMTLICSAVEAIGTIALPSAQSTGSGHLRLISGHISTV